MTMNPRIPAHHAPLLTRLITPPRAPQVTPQALIRLADIAPGQWTTYEPHSGGTVALYVAPGGERGSVTVYSGGRTMLSASTEAVTQALVRAGIRMGLRCLALPSGSPLLRWAGPLLSVALFNQQQFVLSTAQALRIEGHEPLAYEPPVAPPVFRPSALHLELLQRSLQWQGAGTTSAQRVVLGLVSGFSDAEQLCAAGLSAQQAAQLSTQPELRAELNTLRRDLDLVPNRQLRGEAVTLLRAHVPFQGRPREQADPLVLMRELRHDAVTRALLGEMLQVSVQLP